MHGIHHITAVTAQAKQNLDFYTRVLGLRLVKKTVNQDDTSAYHLFYADKLGSPGTDMTFFDWPQAGQKQLGTDTISATMFRVNGRPAFDYWQQRLIDYGLWHDQPQTIDGRLHMAFEDPEGQSLVLVDDQGADFTGQIWDGSDIPSQFALRGFYAAELRVPTLEHLHFILTKVLGWQTTDNAAANNSIQNSRTIYTMDGGGPGKTIHVIKNDQLEPVWQASAGNVHHLAFRVSDRSDLLTWQAKLDQLNLPNSGLVDRYYFQSLYFRVSPGILFELATDGPDFTSDEPLDQLGQHLALPPFLENRRASIEAQLKPLN